MSQVKELQYPDECAKCKSDACSGCGHKQKRADAIDKYNSQFKRKLPIFCIGCILLIIGVLSYVNDFRFTGIAFISIAVFLPILYNRE